LDDWVLCRIYKKNNMQRPVDSDLSDHPMTGMLASIPPSISLGITRPTSGFNVMLENHDHNVVFDTMMNSNDNNLSINLATSNLLPVKRSVSGLFWNDESHTINSPYTKRFLSESNSDGSVMVSRTTEENSGSIASLLTHLPQTTQMQHQQAMLGSMGPYQLSGMNWYA
ncbi:hypothetical protein Tco_1008673, partial [Tanacetum coccineum]